MGIRMEDLPPKAQQQAMQKLQAQRASRLQKKREAENKYHNQQTERLGIRFDSKKEARRFEELMLRLSAGEIRKLRLQQDFTLQEAYTLPTGQRVRAIRYRADFCYEERPAFWRGYEAECPDDGWNLVVEDVKSRATRTREYIIKRKLMLERHNIEIREV